MDKQPWDDLNIGVRLFHPYKIFLAIVFTDIQNHLLCTVNPVFPEIVIARDKIIELFHIFQGHVDTLLPPKLAIIYQGVMKSIDSPLKFLTSSLPNGSL
jgi:hypothetical protein